MKDQPDNHIKSLREEIYLIDPTLRDQADLPNLIASLEVSRPAVIISPTFVKNLRTSLLSTAGATLATSSPFYWWATRLTPIGIALLLLVIFIPKPSISPTEKSFQHESIPTLEMTPESGDQMPPSQRKQLKVNEDALESLPADNSSMMMMESIQGTLIVAPPPIGKTITITSVTLPADGWLVIYGDDAISEVIGSMFLEAGVHSEVEVLLSNTLTYPQMITVVIYTGTSREQFIATDESILIDPNNNEPLQVTVPVISELELQQQ